MKISFHSISFKLGLLFSGVFFGLLILLGLLLYGLFTNFFVDYVKHDLLTRAGNHAKVLQENYSQGTIEHVVLMEKGVITDVLITDSAQRIVGSSEIPDLEMKRYILKTGEGKFNKILENDWRNHRYIVAVTAIGDGDLGYVYMYYPTSVLKETVQVLKLLIGMTGIGGFFIAFGLIGMLSRKITNPLRKMKEATNKMALGKYKQSLDAKGKDEIAQLATSIQRLGEQLQHYEDTRNDFLAAISHELRTPLTYIKGYSDVLMKGKVMDSKDQWEYLKIINEEAKRVTFLVNDLFEMSKLQVGKFELVKGRISINQIIDKVISNLKPIASDKGIHLHHHSPNQLPLVDVDGLRIEQAIYNLIENAIKYSDHGEVSIRSYALKEDIVIEIQDFGMGIPASEITKIWERFYRVEKSRARKTGGTGLGLYVAKQIIEAHGGEIKVSSVEGKGTMFRIYLKSASKHTS